MEHRNIHQTIHKKTQIRSSAPTNEIQLEHMTPNPIKKITVAYHEVHATPSFRDRVLVRLDPSDGINLNFVAHAVVTSVDVTNSPRRLE